MPAACILKPRCFLMISRLPPRVRILFYRRCPADTSNAAFLHSNWRANPRSDACYTIPARGLDVRAAEDVREAAERAPRQKGFLCCSCRAIFRNSSGLSDRIIVLYQGKMCGRACRRTGGHPDAWPYDDRLENSRSQVLPNADMNLRKAAKKRIERNSHYFHMARTILPFNSRFLVHRFQPTGCQPYRRVRKNPANSRMAFPR